MIEWMQKQANQKKLNAVLESQYGQLYRIAYAWCQSDALAQDLVQDTMLKALQNAEKISSFENVDHWLCKMMHNLFYDNCRYNARWQQGDMDEVDAQLQSDSVETLYIKKQGIDNIHDAIGVLPLDQREVIVLVDLQGFSYQETANTIGVPVGTVMSRLSRARDKLKKLISSEKLMTRYRDNVVKLSSLEAKKESKS